MSGMSGAAGKQPADPADADALRPAKSRRRRPAKTHRRLWTAEQLDELYMLQEQWENNKTPDEDKWQWIASSMQTRKHCTADSCMEACKRRRQLPKRSWTEQQKAEFYSLLATCKSQNLAGKSLWQEVAKQMKTRKCSALACKKYFDAVNRFLNQSHVCDFANVEVSGASGASGASAASAASAASRASRASRASGASACKQACPRRRQKPTNRWTEQQKAELLYLTTKYTEQGLEGIELCRVVASQMTTRNCKPEALKEYFKTVKRSCQSKVSDSANVGASAASGAPHVQPNVGDEL